MAEPVSAPPDQRFDLGCADIEGAFDIASMFDVPAPAQDPVEYDSMFYGGGAYPQSRSALIRQAGGLRCIWANEIRPWMPGAQDSGELVPGVQVSILPAAAQSWAEFSPNESYRCDTPDKFSLCGVDSLVGEYWVSISFEMANAERGSAFVSAVEGAVAELGASRSLTIPGTAKALGSVCPTLNPADLAGLVASDGQLVGVSSNREAGIFVAAARQAGSLYCSLNISEDKAFLTVTTLPDGAWAMNAYASSNPPPQRERVTIPGLDATETAELLCVDDYRKSCEVTFTYGGNLVDLVARDFPLFLGQPFDDGVPEGTEITPAREVTLISAVALVKSLNAQN